MNSEARLRRRHKLLQGFVIIVILFLILPSASILLSSFTTTKYVLFPPEGFTLAWYGNFFGGDRFWPAIVRSLLTAVAAIGITLVVGVPASYAMSRYRFRGRELLSMMTLAPIVIPEMISAIALFQLMRTIGLEPSLPVLVAGHALLTLPFMIRAVTASLDRLDPRIEEAAKGLGAGPLRAFFGVSLPLIWPGVFAGAMFVFVTSMDVFLVSMFLSEIFTLPVDIFWTLRFASDPTVLALASIMIVLTVPTVVVFLRVIGIEGILGVGRG